jgi:signal transduction histidine kinase
VTGDRPGWSGSAEELEEVLRLAADPITVQDATGRLVYANEAAARQMGFATAGEMLAAPIDQLIGGYELLDEGGQPLPADSLPGRRALRGEAEPAAIVGFRLTGEADTRWSIVQAAPVLSDGAVRYVINAFQDVTRLKHTDDRLRILADAGAILADSTDYQATLQALAELVVPLLADWCVVDVVEASEVRRIAVAHPNPAKRAMMQDLERRFPTNPDAPGGVREVIESGKSRIISSIPDGMLEAAAQDAEHLELLRGLGLRSAAVVPLIARGQVLGAMTLAGAESGHTYREEDRGFLEDLGRRAAVAVDNARLLHEAKEAIRLRDDFLAMASHDMRTPLQAILSNVQLATRRIDGVGPDAPAERREALRENLERAEQTTHRLSSLVGDLLDVAMLRSGREIGMEMGQFDLVEAARRIADAHQSTAPGHRISVQGPPAVTVHSDRVRFERVLDNLVANAVKYSPTGGDVILELGEDDSTVHVAVRDHGIGIPAAELHSVFEPYHRGSNASTMRGIGLGLSGARAVIRQLGGELTANSTEGAGSTFVVRLPREPRADR